MTHSSVQRYFDGTYFSINYGDGPASRLRRLFRRRSDAIVAHCCDLLADRPPRSLLDLGCGTGFLLHEAHGRFAPRMTGVDASPRSVADARARLAGIDVQLQTGFIEEAASLTGQFDAIVSLGLFDYVRLDAQLLVRILASARRQVILTLPRARWNVQRLVRRSWLCVNGVSLFAYDWRDVETLSDAGEQLGWEAAPHTTRDTEDNLWLVLER